MKKVLWMLMGTVIGGVIGATVVGKVNKKIIVKREEKIDKFKLYYNILNQWIINKQNGKEMSLFFEKEGYKSIAIYGMGEMGNRFYEEIEKSEKVRVKYIIDKEAKNIYAEVPIYSIEDDLEDVDAIVVTSTFAFEQIKEKLEVKTECSIISLEEVVFDI